MSSGPTFSDSELERYSRHFNLPEFNAEGQKKLKSSKVLIVGAGGLGCPALLYLAAAGVGTIGIVDFDAVDLSNLQRQVLFTVDDLGKSKAICAAKRLRALNPDINIIVHETKLDSTNALDIMKDYDLTADGSDNFPTRYLVNDACVLLNKPNIYGAVYRFEGQVSVFNYEYEDGTRGPQYRDIYPTPPPPELVQSCADGGVLGVLPGIIGSLMASEIIKVLCGIGDPLAGKIYLFDALTFESRTLKFNKNPKTKQISSLIDYEDFCSSSRSEKPIKEISAAKLKSILAEKYDEWQIIDVREPYEYHKGNIGGVSVPLAEIDNHTDKIKPNKKAVLVCRSGTRSIKAIRKLEKKGFTNLYNLKGGLIEWVKNIDQGLPLA